MLSFSPSKPKRRSIWDETGVPQRGNRLQQEIEQGLPYTAYSRVAQYANMTTPQLASALGISMPTLRRRAKNKYLKVDESDKLYRVAQLINAATELFAGDKDKALTWLKTPARGLNGHTPIMMAETYAGTTEVLDLIGRLEHGVFS